MLNNAYFFVSAVSTVYHVIDILMLVVITGMLWYRKHYYVTMFCVVLEFVMLYTAEICFFQVTRVVTKVLISLYCSRILQLFLCEKKTYI